MFKIKYITICNVLVFIIALFCFLSFIITDSNYILFLLPFVYLIIFNVCHKSRRLFGKLPGITVIYLITFLRYVLTPFVICNKGELSIFANNYNYINQAIIVMLYEMIAIFITLELTAKKSYDLFKKSQSSHFMTIVKPPLILIFIIFIVVSIIYITNDNVVNFNILGLNNDMPNTIDGVSTWPKIIWDCLLAWIYIYILNILKNKFYGTNSGNRYIFISIIITLVYILVIFISQASISRWYTMVSAFVAVFILLSFYSEKKSIIIKSIAVPVLFLLFVSTVVKMDIYSSNSQNKFTSMVSDILSPTSVDTYLAGPVSVNNSIGLKKTNEVGLTNVIYDICNNMPYVNHLIKEGNSTVYLYNDYIGRIFNGSRGDQIIPLVGQSIIYFSILFAPLLSVVSVLFFRFADKMFVKTITLSKYVWGIVSVWFGITTILNLTINLSWIYSKIIPMFFIFYLLDKVIPKIKINRKWGKTYEQ